MVEGGRSQIQRRRPPLPIQIPDRVLLHLERQRNLSPQSAPSNGLSPAAMAKPSHSPGPLSIHQQKKSISKILYSEEFWKDLSRGESRNGEETRGSLSGHHQCGESCSRRPRDAQLSLTRIVAECSLLLVFLLAGAGTNAALSMALIPAVFRFEESLEGGHAGMRDALSYVLLSGVVGIVLLSVILLALASLLKRWQSLRDSEKGGRMAGAQGQLVESLPRRLQSGLNVMWRLWRGGKMELIPGNPPQYEIRERGLTFSL